MNSRRRVDQYLERYTLTESGAAAQLAADCCLLRYERALCIPMYDERIDLITALRFHPGIRNTLVVLVINAPDSAPLAALTRTRELLAALLTLSATRVSRGNVHFLRMPAKEASFSLLIMDHCSPGHTLPENEGVGLARKLGTDTALELWHRDVVRSPWLYQTDADATIPDNYFVNPDPLLRSAAIHLDFEHVNPKGVSLAQSLYDLKLDYFVAGLGYAQSPYAHYSVGSSIIIHADFYAVVRGYPKYSAGEDFHLLNKLAKEGHIAFDKSRTVRLRERQSMRVPFGTGPGVARIESSDTPLSAARYYAPDCFVALGQWLSFIEYCGELFAGNDSFDAQDSFAQFVNGDGPTSPVMRALSTLNLFSWVEQTLCKNASSMQCLSQLRRGMDGLRTLRLIHALRDQGFANINATEAAVWLDEHAGEHVRSRCDRYRSLIQL